uniref:Uncharacterized protein n=1 Tax=Cannabis sativa TaxID=3483 RepID=A0A803Q641_CANSA
MVKQSSFEEKRHPKPSNEKIMSFYDLDVEFGLELDEGIGAAIDRNRHTLGANFGLGNTQRSQTTDCGVGLVEQQESKNPEYAQSEDDLKVDERAESNLRGLGRTYVDLDIENGVNFSDDSEYLPKNSSSDSETSEEKDVRSSNLHKPNKNMRK